MNPIISNALADLEVVQSRLREHRAACLSLQLDEIELKEFLAKARSYEERGGRTEDGVLVVPDPTATPDGGERLRGHRADYDNADKVITESGRVLKDKLAGEGTTSEPSNSGAPEDITGDLSTTPSRDEIPTIPLATEGEESVAVPEIDPAPRWKPTVAEMVAKVHAEHPDWTASRIADEIGKRAPVVRRAAQVAGIKLPAGIPGRKGVPADQDASKPQEAQKPAPAPKAQPEPKPQSVASAAAPRHVSTRPVAQPPKGAMFRLRNAEGLYLHCDLSAMLKKGLQFTTKGQYPWQGNERQLLAVRKMLPQTIELREEVIQ